MLERLSQVPEDIVAVKAIGKVTREDYDRVLEPLLDTARREGRRLRFLYDMGPAFQGFTPGAAWEDAKLGLQSLHAFIACALVTDHEWIREAGQVAHFILPCPVKVFPNCDRDKAIAWLGSLPHEVGLTHRMLADKGVLVIEAKGTLHAQDFDALGLTADAWIEAHGALKGVVVHALEFPQWENLGSLVRHVQFVRDHHRKVERIALAADGALASLAPRLGEHFIRAEVRTFRFDELATAVMWAAGPPAGPAAP